MNLLQKDTCRAIVNVFETGKIRGDYGAITVMRGDTGHLSYGRSQTTLGSGNLFRLLERYCQDASAQFRKEISELLPRFGMRDFSLDSDRAVQDLLRRAGREDPVMRSTQDQFFNQEYLAPALAAAESIGVTEPLGQAVVYDSHIQGGWKILAGRMGKVTERGDKEWVGQYIDRRREWLLSLKPPVPVTVYRMDSFKRLISDDKWDLKLPVCVHGVEITAESLAGNEPQLAGDTPRILRLSTPYLRGEDVKAIQTALSKQYTIAIDGIYGPYTDALVKMWQKSKNITNEQGVGPETRKSLQVGVQAAKAGA
jgi:chitosanase